MVRKVIELISKQGVPLLNLTEESFRIGFSRPFGDVPRHWCTNLEFGLPGQTVSLADMSGGTAFIPFDVASMGLSMERDRERVLRGNGFFTIRHVKDTAGGGGSGRAAG